jgi:ABC-type dipeptide/oligopeptide/nickel transport system permease component
MGQQIAHRLLISFPALLGVLFLCFCLLRVVPADPAMIIAGPDAKAETIAAIRLELGLDRSIPIQFFEYILRVLRGDLGRSIISNRMVSEELAMTIGPTVELMLGAMLIAVPSGLALGTLAAVNRGRLADRVIMACSVAGVSMPVFIRRALRAWLRRWIRSYLVPSHQPTGGTGCQSINLADNQARLSG